MKEKKKSPLLLELVVLAVLLAALFVTAIMYFGGTVLRQSCAAATPGRTGHCCGRPDYSDRANMAKCAAPEASAKFSDVSEVRSSPRLVNAFGPVYPVSEGRLEPETPGYERYSDPREIDEVDGGQDAR